MLKNDVKFVLSNHKRVEFEKINNDKRNNMVLALSFVEKPFIIIRMLLILEWELYQHTHRIGKLK